MKQIAYLTSAYTSTYNVRNETLRVPIFARVGLDVDAFQRGVKRNIACKHAVNAIYSPHVRGDWRKGKKAVKLMH